MRHIITVCAVVIGVLGTPSIYADPTYSDILDLNDSATGVRGTDTGNTGNVILTGSLQSSGITQGLLWTGNIYNYSAQNPGTYYNIAPDVQGQTLSSYIYYGPDTPAFNASLAPGQIRAVGTYQIEEVSGTFGYMYTGALESKSSAAVTYINVSGAVNTIPHSTAGGLTSSSNPTGIVVGAYDTGSPATGGAFIFDIYATQDQIFLPELGHESSLYGVWHVSEENYVIVGGARNANEGDAMQALIANYNAATKEVTNLTYYSYSSVGAEFGHFEGITAVEGGYNLIGTVSNTGDGSPIGAALAFVSVDQFGVFNPNAIWTPIDVAGSALTTGNTVYQDVGIGVYTTSGGIQTYTAAVPEPATTALVVLGLASLLLRSRRPSQA